MIKIITVGKLKENYLQDAVIEYLKRLKKYTNISLIEVKDEEIINDQEKVLEKEANSILKHLKEKEYIITLEIEGEIMDSISFSKKLDKTFQENSNLVFIIGGSLGLSQKIKEKSSWKLSFSKMTFPHQLFRILLLEQIYRAYKINNNETYHK